jgi:hypothetical protein
MNDLPSDLAGVDAALRRAASSVSYPPTPAVAPSLRESGLYERRRLPWETAGAWLAGPAAKYAIAAVGVCAVILGIALGAPQSRDALADFFGLGRVDVSIQPIDETAPPVLSPASFARPASLDEAEAISGFEPRLPAQDGVAGLPDAVYLQGEAAHMPVVIMSFKNGGYTLSQTREGRFDKSVPDESQIRELEIDGNAAIWFEGGGHVASFLDAQGRVVVETRRLVGGATLLWEDGDVTYRIETALPLEQAVAIAQSLE